MKDAICLLAAILAIGVAHAQPHPHPAQSGPKASAATVNENFARVSGQIAEVESRVNNAATKAEIAQLASRAAAAEAELQTLKDAVAALKGIAGLPEEDLSWILWASTSNIPGGFYHALMNGPIESPYTRTWAVSLNASDNAVVGAHCPVRSGGVRLPRSAPAASATEMVSFETSACSRSVRPRRRAA